MMRSLWIAKTGLDTQQANLDTIANNLANASTTAYKTQRAMFQDTLYQTMREPGSYSSAGFSSAVSSGQQFGAVPGQAFMTPDGLQVGTGAQLQATERINLQGALLTTANPLDVAIKGNGYFQVLMPDGTMAYTRDGGFSVNQNGDLVTSAGYPVVGSGSGGSGGINIPSGTTSITITTDGKVQYTLSNLTTAYTAGQILISNFVNTNGLVSIGGNLALETPASGPAVTNIAGTNGLGQTIQNSLEQSNVNVADQLVQMIAAQRLYEIQARAITASDQMLKKIAQL